MTTVSSPTSTERLLRIGLFALLVSGYSAWSLWDGFVAYPRENVAVALREKLGIEPPTIPSPNPLLNQASASEITPGMAFSQVESRIGSPAATVGNNHHFFGPSGFLTLSINGQQVTQATWTPGPRYSPTDLLVQKAIGFILLPIAIVALAHLLRVAWLPVRVDATGLRVPGKKLIPLDAILEVKTASDGAADQLPVAAAIRYRQGDAEKLLELDTYLVKDLGAVVRAIQDHRSK